MALANSCSRAGPSLFFPSANNLRLTRVARQAEIPGIAISGYDAGQCIQKACAKCDRRSKRPSRDRRARYRPKSRGPETGRTVRSHGLCAGQPPHSSGLDPRPKRGRPTELGKQQRSTRRMNSAAIYSEANLDVSAMAVGSLSDHAPVSIELARNCGRSGTDDCGGWPAQSPWERTVRTVSGPRDLDRYWALRSLLGRLERRSLLAHAFWMNCPASYPEIAMPGISACRATRVRRKLLALGKKRLETRSRARFGERHLRMVTRLASRSAMEN